jgi:hypothetical protein
VLSKEKQNFIKALADENGRVDPQALIAAARDPSCILHKDFEWDVHKAAQKHWADRACELIRFVKLEVRIDRKTIVAPYYVADPQRETRKTSYVELARGANDRELADAIFREELGRISQAISRAQKVAKVLGLNNDLKRLAAAVAALQIKIVKPKPKRGADKRNQDNRSLTA